MFRHNREKRGHQKTRKGIFFFVNFQSYEECFKIMTDIAFMVKEEGEMLNDIEGYLNSA